MSTWGGGMTERHDVRVSVQGAHHFLYLPLLFADNQNYFGLLNERYQITLEEAKPATDRQVVRDVLERPKQVWFGVCDPMALVGYPIGGLKPAVLAALVTNSAFLAVNHGCFQPRRFRDLAQYPKIVSYREDTTSYAIAKRIAQLGGRSERDLILADAGLELSDFDEQADGTLVITPDLLTVQAMMARGERIGVELELSRTPEYQHVLSTALISRMDVVDEHEEFVVSFLSALDRSMRACRAMTDEVIAFAERYWRVQATTAALRQANRTRLLPGTLEVFLNDWLQAARAKAEASKGTPSEEALNKAELEAEQAFDRWVEPYQHFITERVPRHAERRTVSPPLARVPWGPWIAFVTLFLAVGAGLTWWLGGLRGWEYAFLLTFVLIPLGVLLRHSMHAHGKSRLARPFGLAWLAIALVAIVVASPLFPTDAGPFLSLLRDLAIGGSLALFAIVYDRMQR